MKVYKEPKIPEPGIHSCANCGKSIASHITLLLICNTPDQVKNNLVKDYINDLTIKEYSYFSFLKSRMWIRKKGMLGR